MKAEPMKPAPPVTKRVSSLRMGTLSQFFWAAATQGLHIGCRTLTKTTTTNVLKMPCAVTADDDGVCTGATGAGAVDPASHRHSTGRNRCRASGQGLEQFCQGLGLAVARRHHGLGRGHRPGNAYRWVVEAEAGFAGRVVK